MIVAAAPCEVARVNGLVWIKGMCCEGNGDWQSGQDSEISLAVCKHLDKLEGVTVAQYHSLLQKRDYPLEEREERNNAQT